MVHLWQLIEGKMSLYHDLQALLHRFVAIRKCQVSDRSAEVKVPEARPELESIKKPLRNRRAIDWLKTSG